MGHQVSYKKKAWPINCQRPLSDKGKCQESFKAGDNWLFMKKVDIKYW